MGPHFNECRLTSMERWGGGCDTRDNDADDDDEGVDDGVDVFDVDGDDCVVFVDDGDSKSD